MLKKISLCALAFLLFAGGAIHSNGATKKELSAEEVKRRVESFGVGATARVKVKLRDGDTMEGFIDSAGDDYFYLVRTDSRIGVAAVIAYADVAQLSGQKSTLDWRGIAYKAGMGARMLFNVLRAMHLQGPQIAPGFPDR